MASTRTRWCVASVVAVLCVQGSQQQHLFGLDLFEARIYTLYTMHRALPFLSSPQFLHLEAANLHVCSVGDRCLIDAPGKGTDVL